MVDKPLLEVEDLRVRFDMPDGIFEAVRGVSFSTGREKLGMVGESGSGKSLTGRSLLRLVPGAREVVAQKIAFDGIARSTRHKSGVAMRFPRINRIRTDKPADEADTVDSLLRLVP